MTRHVAKTPYRFLLRQAVSSFIHYYSLKELPGTLRAGVVRGAKLALATLILPGMFIFALALCFFPTHPNIEIADSLASTLSGLSQFQLIALVNEIRFEVYRFALDTLGVFVGGCMFCGGFSRFGTDRSAGRKTRLVQ